MNCPNCDKPVQGNEKFCRYCGFKLRQAEPVSAVEPEEADRTETQPEVQPEIQPEVQPSKKSKLPLIIIISVVAAAVITAGVFFAIWFFGGRSGGKDAASSAASSASSSEAQTDTTSQPEQVGAQLAERVASFEKALNDNDEQAIADQFAPELRDLKVRESSAFKSLNELIGQTGQTLTYKLSLSDDVKADGDAASGTLKITVSVPVIGDQSVNAKITFKKSGGKWYISELK